MDCTMAALSCILLAMKLALNDEQARDELTDLDIVRKKWFDELKTDFNLVLPDESYPVLLLYIAKPIFVKIIRDCRRMTNNTYYTAQTFCIRCFYDLVFIASFILYLFETQAITPYQLALFLSPAFILELILYFVSVRPANKKALRIHYRMIRSSVNTQQQNDAMWSTDDQSEG
jgi:hypothetical protein